MNESQNSSTNLSTKQAFAIIWKNLLTYIIYVICAVGIMAIGFIVCRKINIKKAYNAGYNNFRASDSIWLIIKREDEGKRYGYRLLLNFDSDIENKSGWFIASYDIMKYREGVFEIQPLLFECNKNLNNMQVPFLTIRSSMIPKRFYYMTSEGNLGYSDK